MITVDDVLLFFPTFVEVVLMAFVIARLITFIPSFILSFVRSIKNKSIMYVDVKSLDSTLDKGNLDTQLDRSEFGVKNLILRWLK
jgi:hypothetical protein